MEIYTLILVMYDCHKFESVEMVGVDLDKLIQDKNIDLPVFSEPEESAEDFVCPNNQDGYCYYYWKEWSI